MEAKDSRPDVTIFMGSFSECYVPHLLVEAITSCTLEHIREPGEGGGGEVIISNFFLGMFPRARLSAVRGMPYWSMWIVKGTAYSTVQNLLLLQQRTIA